MATVVFETAKRFANLVAEFKKHGKLSPLSPMPLVVEGDKQKALEMGDACWSDQQWQSKGFNLKGVEILGNDYQVVEEGETEDGDPYIIIAPIATTEPVTTEPTNLEVAQAILENANEISTYELLEYANEYNKPLTDADDQHNFCQWLEGNKGVFESFNLAYIAEDTDRLNNVLKFGDRCRIFKWCYLSSILKF